MRVGIFLPQAGLHADEILDRAARCDELGIESLWFYDHLGVPGLPDVSSLEGWTLATAVLARTTRLRVGHLVLCTSFRHPAVLASMAATLDVISGGRLELGLGSGSWAPEHHAAGLPWGSLRERSDRLAEAIAIVTALLAGETVTHRGEHYVVDGLRCRPDPLQRPRPPIVVGGVHPVHTLPIVARYADVWNVPTYAIGRLDVVLDDLHRACEQVGRDPATITVSAQVVVGVAARPSDAPAVRATAERRYGSPGYGLAEGGVVGTPPEVADGLAKLRARGVDQVMVLTHDRASPTTIELLATEVVPLVRESAG